MADNRRIYAYALNQKWTLTFQLIGFTGKTKHGEVHLTIDGNWTTIFRGEEEEEVMAEAWDMVRAYIDRNNNSEQ